MTGRERAQGGSGSTTLTRKGNCAGLNVSGVLGGRVALDGGAS